MAGAASGAGVWSWLELVSLGLLGRVRVLDRRVDLQLLDDLPAEHVLREHATHRQGQRRFRLLGQEVAVAALGDSTRVTAVAVVQLLVCLIAGDLDFLGVDDDDEIAAVHVRREGWLVLATEQRRNAAGNAAKRLVLGVDHPPLALLGSVFRLSNKGAHVSQRFGERQLLAASLPSVKEALPAACSLASDPRRAGLTEAPDVRAMRVDLTRSAPGHAADGAVPGRTVSERVRCHEIARGVAPLILSGPAANGGDRRAPISSDHASHGQPQAGRMA